MFIICETLAADGDISAPASFFGFLGVAISLSFASKFDYKSKNT